MLAPPRPPPNRDVPSRHIPVVDGYADGTLFPLLACIVAWWRWHGITHYLGSCAYCHYAVGYDAEEETDALRLPTGAPASEEGAWAPGRVLLRAGGFAMKLHPSTPRPDGGDGCFVLYWHSDCLAVHEAEAPAPA